MAETIPSDIFYPEGVAPFGPMRIVRHAGQEAGELNPVNAPHYPNQTFIHRGKELMQDSLLTSEWLPSVTSQDYVDRLVNKAPLMPGVVLFGDTLSKAFRNPREYVGWVALKGSPQDYPTPDSVVAAAIMERTTYGSPIKGLLKRLVEQDRVLTGTVVDPEVEVQNELHDAMLDAHLRYIHARFPGEAPTLRAFAADVPYLKHLGDLGFTVEESQTQIRKDIIPGDVSLEQYKLRAYSIWETRGRIRELNEWMRSGPEVLTPAA